MGQFKKRYMEVEEKLHIIDDIIKLISSDISDDMYDPQLIKDLHSIRNQLFYLSDLMTTSKIDLLYNIISDDFYEIRSQLMLLSETPQAKRTENFHLKVQKLLEELHMKVCQIRKKLQYYSHIDIISSYNSESYYKQQIEEIQKQKEELENALKTILTENKSLQGKSREEKQIQEKRIQEKELQLQLANQQIHNFQKELDEKKKQENAIEEWNSKIKSTFTELKKYLKPIKDEHDRLNKLFYGYLILIGITILFIAFVEYIICSKFCTENSFPDWKNYLMLIHPIPISGALLWVFISQLNRSQRQLVILAKHIHEIEHIEGLLLSLNSLSINIDESMKRINSAIDKLLNNHLSLGEKTRKYNEESIINEEHKDTIPADIVLRILKEIKSLPIK